MNYDIMTDTELLHYLSLYSNDPLTLRLATMLTNTHGSLVSDLEAAGMDPDTWLFETDWQSMYPGDYIQQLRRDLNEAESALAVTQSELDEVREKYKELKTRSIMDFVQEVWQERKDASNRVLMAQEDIQRAEEKTLQIQQENNKLREQIDMWARMNRV